MRTTLFLSSLFAVSLIGSVALAEKPVKERPVREPRVLTVVRSHGDAVDKSYGSVGGMGKAAVAQAAGRQEREARSPIDRGASRVNCSSEAGIDCGARAGRAPDRNAAATPGADAGRSVPLSRAPGGVLQKVLGSDRMACNEADECSMGHAAAQRAWSNAGGKGASGHGSKEAQVSAGSLSTQKMGERTRGTDETTGARMACNEADECMMSSKTAKKLWAYQAVRAGTWNPSADKARADGKDASKYAGAKDKASKENK